MGCCSAVWVRCQGSAVVRRMPVARVDRVGDSPVRCGTLYCRRRLRSEAAVIIVVSFCGA